MEVIPAIDIRGGRCVQLYQGDYDRETVFSESPLDVASHWAAQGASRIHVVDLDGARAGAPVNIDVIGDIAAAVRAPVQMGGGIRSLGSARRALELGVSRVVFGTAVVAEPELVESAIRELGDEAVMASVDARDGLVSVQGWTRNSGSPVAEVVRDIEAMGVRRFVYTDVGRDGTLTEPNFRAIEGVFGQTELRILVAGGISTIGHLRMLAELGVEAAIVGTAVYTGDIDLGEAIAAVNGNRMNTN